MATVETTTVTLTINGREVTVPKGLSVVEAAAEAGVEIPVFCYEPRLGAGIGACRMCLCEIEGMPKLQTACTTPAADGMVIDSHSARAREGHDAVLEFLLLNHPLDCPVCDKGGECPLQDLTFRYGPGVTRMTLPKRTQEKPVPISPLIKLDRERCILCYRCTRFSEDVSGDMQLVPENRGANSVITTFEGRPYTNEFSGNVTELCPVGALTSTTYRFRARPWEIQNVPTVCTGCAVGCNTYSTIREGQVARVLSRNHPGVDEGWLCDRGRYALGHLRAPDRVTQNLIRGGRGLEAVSTAEVLDHVADRLRATVERFGAGSVAVLASGEQTNEEAYAWARILRGARRRGERRRAGERPLVGRPGALRGLDRGRRPRAHDRRRRRPRPRPPRARHRALDPQGRARGRPRGHRRPGRHPPRHAARRRATSRPPPAPPTRRCSRPRAPTARWPGRWPRRAPWSSGPGRCGRRWRRCSRTSPTPRAARCCGRRVPPTRSAPAPPVSAPSPPSRRCSRRRPARCAR